MGQKPECCLGQLRWTIRAHRSWDGGRAGFQATPHWERLGQGSLRQERIRSAGPISECLRQAKKAALGGQAFAHNSAGQLSKDVSGASGGSDLAVLPSVAGSGSGSWSWDLAPTRSCLGMQACDGVGGVLPSQTPSAGLLSGESLWAAERVSPLDRRTLPAISAGTQTLCPDSDWTQTAGTQIPQ
jgi:hypothetical protein